MSKGFSGATDFIKNHTPQLLRISAIMKHEQESKNVVAPLSDKKLDGDIPLNPIAEKSIEREIVDPCNIEKIISPVAPPSKKLDSDINFGDIPLYSIAEKSIEREVVEQAVKQRFEQRFTKTKMTAKAKPTGGKKSFSSLMYTAGIIAAFSAGVVLGCSVSNK